MLNHADILALRMDALLLAQSLTGRSVAEIVEWFGAMQAQDVSSGEWSLGVRLPGSTIADVHAALERKEAVRTWPMRGTVHLVPARDAAWMVEVMGAKPLSGARRRREYLGLDESVATRAVEAIGSALAGGNRLSRRACLEAVEAADIALEQQWGYHLLWYASQLGVTCIAPHVDGEQTFALLDEYVPDPVRPERDEALGIMAERYFRSHGPATVKEFARWTGLGVRDCRAGVAICGSKLREVPTALGDLIATAEALDGPVPKLGDALLTLPGFDEYMLGYGDRSLIIEPERMKHVVPGSNGVFRSTLIRFGRVVGTWKRSKAATSIPIEIEDFGDVGPDDDLMQALQPYADFVGLPARLKARRAAT